MRVKGISPIRSYIGGCSTGLLWYLYSTNRDN